MVLSAVDITWVTPDKRGSDITSYTTYVLDSASTMQTVCDSSLANTCSVPLTTLYSYGLTQGELVVVQVTATNAYGASEMSEVNTGGALVETVPHAPGTIPRRASDTSQNQI